MAFKRNIYKELKADVTDPRISILFGARQVGKTYLMKKIAKEFKNDQYFNLERSDHLRLFNTGDSEIVDLLKSAGSLIFLDEFHYVENISKIFKVIYDQDAWDGKQDIKIFASGSSALEMHKHLKESLAGRFKKYFIKPLNFEEFQSHSDIDTDLEEYLKYGSLPGTYNLRENPSHNDKSNYLQNILDSYIQKDIKSLIAEENIRAFNHLLYILADNQGQIIASSNLASEQFTEKKKNLDIKCHHFDLEDDFDLAKLNNPRLAFEDLEGLIIIDEIQRRPDLFPILRVLADRKNKNTKFLILGSASQDLIQQSSETLAGRIGYIELTPFTSNNTSELDTLWHRGGFPRSFLAKSNEASYIWRDEYIKTFLERDIPNLGIRIRFSGGARNLHTIS